MPGVFIEESLINGGLKTRQWSDPAVLMPTKPNIALYSEMVTDVLLATLSRPSSELYLLGADGGYRADSVKAAWESLAELTGRAITLLQDIEPNEISVGRKYFEGKDMSGRTIGGWAIFISDNLDNGAGYASSYSTPERFASILGCIENELKATYLATAHSHSCFTSCYHCLRSYSNRFVHTHLDWRLGIDMAHLLMGESDDLSLNSPWWATYIDQQFANRFEEFTNSKWTRKNSSLGPCYISANSDTLVVLAHPLRNAEHRLFDREVENIRIEFGVAAAASLDPFSFERRPITTLQQLAARLKT